MSGANIKELLRLVGSGVVLEVIGGSSFCGVLYSVDSESGLVALRDNPIGHQADYNIVNAAHIVKVTSTPGEAVSAEIREKLSSKVAAVPEDTLQKFYARESDQVCSQCLSLPYHLAQFSHVSATQNVLLSGQEDIRRCAAEDRGWSFQRGAEAFQLAAQGSLPLCVVSANNHSRHSRV